MEANHDSYGHIDNRQRENIVIVFFALCFTDFSDFTGSLQNIKNHSHWRSIVFVNCIVNTL